MTSPRELFLAHLDTIRGVTCRIARRKGLDSETESEFAAFVRLRLIEGDYAALASFRGECEWSTYLAAVIHRLFLDFTAENWGRWKPSRVARGLGSLAVDLERMLSRDGLSHEEAIRSLLQREGVRTSRAELERLLARLPLTPRPKVLSLDDGDVAGGVADGRSSIEEDVATEQLRSAAERALVRGLSRMAPQDILILRLRFVSGRTVVSIARLLELEQRPLYRRIEGLLRSLREELLDAGVSRREAADLLGGRLRISLDFENRIWKNQKKVWKKAEVGPSQEDEEAPEVIGSPERIEP